MKKNKNKRGSALVIAVLLLGVISLLLTLVFTMVSGERNITKSYTDDMEVFYDTESLLNRVLRDVGMAKYDLSDPDEPNQYLKDHAGNVVIEDKVHDTDVKISLSDYFYINESDSVGNLRTYSFVAEGVSPEGFSKKIEVDVQGRTPTSDYGCFDCTGGYILDGDVFNG